MPRSVIDSGMKKRGFDYHSLTAIQAYRMASWLGVGYATFISHLLKSLKLINKERFVSLASWEPKKVRLEILGIQTVENLVVADANWIGRAIDCHVGDYIVLPESQIEKPSLFSNVDHRSENVLQAQRPGIARAYSEGWAGFIRISPKDYTGRGCYRFEEEAE